MAAHIRFVRDHHKRVKKIAVVTDAKLGDFAEKIGSHFIAATIKGSVMIPRSFAMSAASATIALSAMNSRKPRVFAGTRLPYSLDPAIAR